MKHCPNPNCPGLEKFKTISEYEDGVQVCADCGTDLADGPAPESFDPPKKEPNPDLKLVAVLTTRSEPDLVIAESILVEAKIPYLVQGGGIQDLFGFGRVVAVNPITGSVKILVGEDDAETAQALLEDLGK